MNSATIKAEIRVDSDLQEILIAELSEMGFTGFEQEPVHLFAYIPIKEFSGRQKQYLSNLSTAFPGVFLMDVDEITDRNWNAIWEASVKPQQIGPFLVRPSWEIEESPKKITIVIDPKMAFGTGYHATTRLMLIKMPDLEIEEKQVLDAGTGTGILAIAAVKLGAQQVFAFDTDSWSRVNAEENIRRNKVEDKIEVVTGSSAAIPEGKKYDVILANINRNALIELMPDFVFHMKPAGKLCFSGLQAMDKDAIVSAAGAFLLELTDESILDGWVWLCFKFGSGSQLSE